MYRYKNSKGFTLIEMAIVLVVIGLLVSIGAALIGPLTKRAKLSETRETVKAVREAFFGYAVKNGYLPGAGPPDPFGVVGAVKRDSWGRDILYYGAPEVQGATTNICGVTSTTMQVNECTDANCTTYNTKSNIAFIIYSLGEDGNGAGTGTVSPFSVRLPGSPYSDGGINYEYDDVVQYVSLDELRASRNCPQQLAISSTSPLPEAEEDSFYSYSFQAVGGLPPYTWSTGTWSGLSLNAAGLLSGIVNTTAGGTGALTACTTTVTVSNVTVTDSATPPAPAGPTNFTLTVRPRPPSISNTELPTTTVGTVSASYATLVGTGGTTPYTWSLTGNPAWLTINASTGVLSINNPTTSGTYSFTATLTEGCGTSPRPWSTSKVFTITVNPSGSSTSSTGSSTSSSSTGSTSSSTSSGAPAPTCSLTANPTELLKGATSTLTWTITNGPANGSFSPSSGTCTSFSSSTGGSCTTAALSAPTSTDFVLTVSNANGSSNCSRTVYTKYRVWNNTGARRDFMVDGTCRRVNNNNEITTAALFLSFGETIDRYSTNNGTCGGAVAAQLTFATAAAADVNNNSQVNFTGSDR